MTQRPLPEAIRGVWHMVKTDVEHARARKTYETYTFHLDGTFVRLLFKEGFRRETEQGTYTFDGEFLITRGRSTETYRVDSEVFWRWELESRKQTIRLMRTLAETLPQVTLSADTQRDLRILPLRTKFERVHDDLGLYDLTYTREGEPEVLLGQLAWEARPEFGEAWCGLLILSEGLDESVWLRIVREVFFEMHAPNTEGMTTLDVQILGQDGMQSYDV